MVIAQFWAFAADLYTEEQGKRLFPLIGVGSSLGAWLGSMRAGQLVRVVGPTASARRRRAVILVVVRRARAGRRPHVTARGSADDQRGAADEKLAGGRQRLQR